MRFGYRRLTVLLQRDGWHVNAKRIYRLYTEDGFTVRTKHRTKAAGRARVPQAVATAPNQRWRMDFRSERVADGRWFLILTVVDQYTRECVCLRGDQPLSGDRHVPSPWAIGANLPVGSWMPGPTVTAFSWILFVRASLWRMASSRVSMGDYEMSV